VSNRQSNTPFAIPSVWVYLIIAASFLAYGSTLLSGYSWDDGSVIGDNRFVHNWRNLPLVFSQKYVRTFGEATYRPIVTLTYFIDGAVWRAHPAGGHAFNLVLHTLNAVLVYLLAQRFASRRLAAGVAGILFAVHPILSEVVNQVSFREDLLCASFALGCALCFFKHQNDRPNGFRRHIWGSIFLTLALFSKEMALSLPLVLVIYSALFRVRNRPSSWTRTLSRLSPYLCVWVVFSGLILTGLWKPILPSTRDAYVEHRYDMFWMGHGTSPNEVEKKREELGLVLFEASTVSAKIVMMPRILTHHLLKIIMPVRLNTEYGWPLSGVSGSWPWIIGGIVSIGYLVLTAAVWRRHAIVGFGLLAFIVLLIPVFGLLQNAYIVADRFLYLPMTVLAMTVAAALVHGIDDSNSVFVRARVFLFVVLVVFFVMLDNHRRLDWNEDRALWRSTVALNPSSAKARVNLGQMYYDQGRPSAAFAQYQLGVVYDPNFPSAYVSLSQHYVDRGEVGKAVETLLKCNKRGIFSSLARYNLAICLQQQGNFAQALRHFEALPRDRNVQYQIGVTYALAGKPAEAEYNLRKALEFDQDFPEVHVSLASLLTDLRRYPEALQLLSRAEQLNPDDCNTYAIRGVILRKTGDLKSAEQMLLKAISCDPKSLPPYLDLAVTQARQGRSHEARINAQRVLQLGARGELAELAKKLITDLATSGE